MSLSVKNYKRLCLAAALCCVHTLSSVQANTTAKNRNDVFGVLDQIDAKAAMPGLDIWVNENSSDPFVEIGDAVYFTMKAGEPVFHTLVYVDSKGSTSVILPKSSPDAQVQTSSDYLVFPPLNDGCQEYTKNVDCFNVENMLKQQGPVGKDTVYLFASKKPMTPEVLGFGSNSDYKDLGKDLSEIENLVQRINSQTQSNPLAVVRYAYSVESDSTEFRTRGLRLTVKEMEKEVMEADQADAEPQTLTFNNINFSWNSDELTVPGRVELDGLGSALVDMQEENGEFPFVELTGHTDSTGPDVYNETLSANRAQSAKRYLVAEHGIPAEQVSTVGAGETIPVDSNSTRDGRAKNRRVEFSVIRPQ